MFNQHFGPSWRDTYNQCFKLGQISSLTPHVIVAKPHSMLLFYCLGHAKGKAPCFTGVFVTRANGVLAYLKRELPKLRTTVMRFQPCRALVLDVTDEVLILILRR
jgi:hypothetical protein